MSNEPQLTAALRVPIGQLHLIVYLVETESSTNGQRISCTTTSNVESMAGAARPLCVPFTSPRLDQLEDECSDLHVLCFRASALGSIRPCASQASSLAPASSTRYTTIIHGLRGGGVRLTAKRQLPGVRTIQHEGWGK